MYGNQLVKLQTCVRSVGGGKEFIITFCSFLNLKSLPIRLFVSLEHPKQAKKPSLIEPKSNSVVSC